DVNIALRFQSFSGTRARFLQMASSQVKLTVVTGDRVADTLVTKTAARFRPIVEYDSTYAPGTKLAVSDGWPLHSWGRFPRLNPALPPTALVHRAELILEQAPGGLSFGSGPALGVVVLPDTALHSATNAALAPSFLGVLVAKPGTPVVINVTKYVYS